MDKDIVPGLAKDIEESFKLKTKESKVLREKLLKLKKKMANHEDSSALAKELGDILAESFKENLKEGVLPDEKMYYNIAERLINPRLKENYDIINDYSKAVQTRLNKDAGLSINAIDSEYNEDKARGIVDYVSNSEKFSDAAETFYSSIENFSMAVVDDIIKSNADFHYKAGLSPKIIRKSNGHCCDWCSGLVGVYDYEDVKDTGNAVFRRHRHCDCTVIYDPGDGGKKRNVHTHKEWTDSEKDDKIKKRIELNKTLNSTINKNTVKKLEEKNWTPEFKAKALKFYRDMNKQGIEFSDHSTGRTVDRVINQRLMSQDEIIKLLKNKHHYIQSDGRLIYNKGNVFFIKNPNTEDIVSVVIRNAPKEEWVKFDG